MSPGVYVQSAQSARCTADPFVNSTSNKWPPCAVVPLMPHSHCARILAYTQLLSPKRTTRVAQMVISKNLSPRRLSPKRLVAQTSLNLIVNINEKMDSVRIVEAVRTRPILYVSQTKSYKDATGRPRPLCKVTLFLTRATNTFCNVYFISYV